MTFILMGITDINVFKKKIVIDWLDNKFFSWNRKENCTENLKIYLLNVLSHCDFVKK